MNNVFKILAVDDVEANLISLRSLLESETIQVTTADSGPHALELLLNTEFALVLLDVQMPEMNGFEVAELMRGREKTKHVPIIFITAINKEDEYIFKGYESGAIDYLFKPINPFILQKKVELFIALYKKQKELEATIQQKEMLMKEVHHRVKNSLALISSFIGLQKMMHDEDIVTNEILDKLIARIASVGLVHEKLYKGNNISQTRLDEYIQDLAKIIQETLDSKNNIKFETQLDHLVLQVDNTISIGLIVTEVVTNSIKYAFENMENGSIKISLSKNENSAILKIADNGKGLPDNFDQKNTDSLGMTLIQSLAAQIQGELQLTNDKGTTFTLKFPC